MPSALLYQGLPSFALPLRLGAWVNPRDGPEFRVRLVGASRAGRACGLRRAGAAPSPAAQNIPLHTAKRGAPWEAVKTAESSYGPAPAGADRLADGACLTWRRVMSDPHHDPLSRSAEGSIRPETNKSPLRRAKTPGPVSRPPLFGQRRRARARRDGTPTG